MAGSGLAAPFFFFTAFLLLLLVTLSVPIIKSIYLFSLSAFVSVGSGILSANASETVKFGIFGWCSSALSASVLTFAVNEPAKCSKPHLGFTISPELQQALSTIDVSDLVDVMQKALSVVLILHPIACGLAFLASLFSLLALLRRHTRAWDMLATLLGVIAAILTTIVFITDIVFVLVAKSKLHQKTEGHASVSWGNAVWLALAAAICAWIASVGACWGVIRGRRERKERPERY